MNKIKKTMWRFYFSIDAEEVFINKMCKKGWKLSGIILGCGFEFVKCNPDEFICRTYFTVDKNGYSDKGKNQVVRNNLVSIGAEIIEETLNMDKNSLIYALRRAELGEFEIHLDLNSIIEEVESRMKYHTHYGIIFISFVALTVMTGNMILTIIEVFAVLTMLVPVPKYRKKLSELKRQRKIAWELKYHKEE